MAHKWTTTLKVFNRRGDLIYKRENIGSYKTLADAVNIYKQDGYYKQFYSGKFDSRNFLYLNTAPGYEWQVWFEQVY